jgi:phosphonate transport system substrate-binding protein
MRRFQRFLLVFVLLCGLLTLSAHDVMAADGRETPPPLRLGIVPFNSTQALLRVHRPLRDYLTHALGREVTIYSARDHEQFFGNMSKGYFDLVVVPEHFLPKAVDDGFIPLVRYRNLFELLLVVRKDSGITKTADLRGKRIGLPDRLSLYYIIGMQWLRTLALHPGKDYLLNDQSSHMTGLLAVDAGQIDVAVTGRPPWMQLNPEVRARLRLIDVGHPTMPSLTTLAHRDLGGDEVARIRAALETFPEHPDGKRFFEDTGYGGFVPANVSDAENARHYEGLIYQLMMPARNASGDAPAGAERSH